MGPGYWNFGGASRCEGRIVTVKLDRNNNELVKVLRDEDGSGKIVVVDVERAYFAVVGENLMNYAHQNHYRGILVNGYIRDTDQIHDIPVMLRALGTCPRKYIPITNGFRDVRVTFAGVEFNSGDYLYADSDGVIVAPEDFTDQQR